MTIQAVKIEFEMLMSFQKPITPAGAGASSPPICQSTEPACSATWMSA
jgi:hypothetical protein